MSSRYKNDRNPKPTVKAAPLKSLGINLSPATLELPWCIPFNQSGVRSMARKSSGEGWALLGLVGAFFGLAWLVGGRGQNNSPLIPDPLEDQIDLAVDSLNEGFGHQWVTYALDEIQRYLKWTHPHVAWLVYRLHNVEQQSQGWTLMTKQVKSLTKKQLAMQLARRLRP
jgi:hypothetical protein